LVKLREKKIRATHPTQKETNFNRQNKMKLRAQKSTLWDAEQNVAHQIRVEADAVNIRNPTLLREAHFAQQFDFHNANGEFVQDIVSVVNGLVSNPPTGATGPQGLQGLQGLPGNVGSTGVAGVAGATGVVGVSGATGVVGVAGATGAVGATGVVGVTGATGAVGATGATGAVGVTGVVGAVSYTNLRAHETHH
jgi:hypothetical protein